MTAVRTTSMLQTCPHCGAGNSESALACSMCHNLLPPRRSSSDAPPPQAAQPPAAPRTIEMPRSVAVSSSEPAWRREVAQRLEAYRARQQQRLGEGPQSALPFSPESSDTRDAVRPQVARERPARAERVEINVAQPELDFSSSDHGAHPVSGLVPVAEVRERGHAGLLDASFLLLTYAGFLVLFNSLGGKLSFGRVDGLIHLAAFFLFYVEYFVLFTALGGATPGMRLRGLTVVDFDGTTPAARQLFWRSFGYVISGATLLVGFLWSLWDEDHLTWHDRISQTYITSADHA